MKFIVNFLFDSLIILMDKVQKYKYNKYKTKYHIDKTFKFNGSGILFNGEGEIRCGKNSYIGIGSSISSNKGYHVFIGANCAISHNVRLYNNSYISNQDFNVFPRQVKYGSIEIGDGVWIGANVVILPGVTIGNNSIIGANSVVNIDIPPYAIASGIPCKVLKFKTNDGTEEACV
jgi:maltose O-acetyltransferase